MKFIKLHHSNRQPIYVNIDKILYLTHVKDISGTETGLCMGYRPDGVVIPLPIDETPEQILEMILDHSVIA